MLRRYELTDQEWEHRLRLITSNTVQESVQEQQELNFENENSIEQRELAHQDLIAAKSLAESS